MCYRTLQRKTLSFFFPFRNLETNRLSTRFYKEELGGDDRNFLHNRAQCSGQPIMVELQEVNKEAIAAWSRIAKILKGRGKYEQSWNDSVRGYMAMHTTNPRYKLTDLGLGEEHPLAPFEHRIGQFFEDMKATTPKSEQ